MTIVHRTYLDWCDGEGEVAVAPTARKFVPELRRLGMAIEEGRARALHVDGMDLQHVEVSACSQSNRTSPTV